MGLPDGYPTDADIDAAVREFRWTHALEGISVEDIEAELRPLMEQSMRRAAATIRAEQGAPRAQTAPTA